MTTNTISLKANKSFLMQAGLALAAVVLFVLPSVSHAALGRQLQLGMSGADVTALQTFLAQDVSIYPSGKVTGYFGSLTKGAVMNFQARNNLPMVGRVGPLTLAAINHQMLIGINGGSGATVIASTISNVSVATGRNSATVNWNTDETAKGVVYYSTSPLVTYEYANSVDVSGSVAMTDNNMRASQNVAISNLAANTTYYYMVYVTDMDGYVTVTWPSTFQTTN